MPCTVYEHGGWHTCNHLWLRLGLYFLWGWTANLCVHLALLTRVKLGIWSCLWSYSGMHLIPKSSSGALDHDLDVDPQSGLLQQLMPWMLWESLISLNMQQHPPYTGSSTPETNFFRDVLPFSATLLQQDAAVLPCYIEFPGSFRSLKNWSLIVAHTEDLGEQRLILENLKVSWQKCLITFIHKNKHQQQNPIDSEVFKLVTMLKLVWITRKSFSRFYQDDHLVFASTTLNVNCPSTPLIYLSALTHDCGQQFSEDIFLF